MNGVSSDNSLAVDREQNIERVVWIDTFYLGIPFDISDTNEIITYTYKKVKTTYTEFFLEFQLQKLRDLQFKIICTPIPGENFILEGNYKLQFHCDINIIDQDTKVFDMRLNEYVIVESFSLDSSNNENFLLADLQGEFEFKILLKMIEYDSILNSNHIVYINEFLRENYQIFNSESVLRDLFYILNVQRLEYIFTGRQNTESLKEKSIFIARAAMFSSEVAYFMKCKKESSTPPFIISDGILNYLLHGVGHRISDKDLITVYLKAHYIGLNFLIVITRHYILKRLEEYEISNTFLLEMFMIDVLKAVVLINDECFFKQLEVNLDKSEGFVEEYLVDKFQNENVNSRFVLLYLKRRIKRLKSISSSIGIGEVSSSKDF